MLATRAEDSGTSGQFGLVLCNAIGTPVDSMYYDCFPEWCFFSIVEKILWAGSALLTIDFPFQSQGFCYFLLWSPFVCGNFTGPLDK